MSLSYEVAEMESLKLKRLTCGAHIEKPATSHKRHAALSSSLKLARSRTSRNAMTCEQEGMNNY
jgi:hypothetical protein